MVFKVKEIQNVNWDVSDIVKKYESLEQLTGLVESKATVLKKFEGKIAQLDIGSFLTFMKDYGEYYELSVRAMDYVTLRYSVATNDEIVAAQMQKIDEQFSELSAKLSFIDIEINDIDDDKFQSIISLPEAKFVHIL